MRIGDPKPIIESRNPELTEYPFSEVKFFQQGEKQTFHSIVNFKNTPLDLYIENSSNTLTDSRSITSKQNLTSFTFYASKNEGYSAKLVLTIDDSYGIYVAGTNVSNYKREMKGLGRELWKISTKLIQKAADELGKPIAHIITKSPYGRLSSEKWEELFLPLLEQRGYTTKEGRDGTAWGKTYYPNKL